MARWRTITSTCMPDRRGRGVSATRTRRSAWGSCTGSPAARTSSACSPALALPTRGDAVIYIAAFGVGTVVAMTAFAAVIGSAGSHVRHGAALYRGMMLAAATIAIAVGAFWLI